MTDDRKTLAELRERVDEIDDRLHDLLMERTEVVRRIGEAKTQGGPVIRPGREAQVLRRLVKRHRGPFPVRVLLRIWREIFSAATALQGPFQVAFVQSEGAPELRALAREHFGVLTPLTACPSPSQVLQHVSETPGTLGVLPLPDASERLQPWWTRLARSGPSAPRIIATLPFMEDDAWDGPAALVVGAVQPEETGEDCSYLVMDIAEPLSRGALRELLAKAGLEELHSQYWSEGGERTLYLLEVDGFVGDDDPRLGRLAEESGGRIAQAWSIGATALPFSAEAPLGAKRKAEQV